MFEFFIFLKLINLPDIDIAVVAQLVEHRLPKPRVAGSSPVYRSAQLKGEGLSHATLDRPFQGSGVYSDINR